MAQDTEPYIDGYDITAAGQNEAHARLYTGEGLNHIRQLFDRAGVYSAGNIDGWGEAYVDATGQNNSYSGRTVQAVSGTFSPSEQNNFAPNADNNIIFDATNLKFLPMITTGSDLTGGTNSTSATEGSWTDTDNAFDGDSTTLATFEQESWSNTTSKTITIGRTFSAATIDKVYVNFDFYIEDASTDAGYIRLESYNGATWDVVHTFFAWAGGSHQAKRGSANALIDVSASVQGLRLNLTGTPQDVGDFFHFYVYDIRAGVPEESVIKQAIPTGTFSSTISSAIGVPFIEDWETGADIQYKLTNATEDTGWLDTMDTSPEVSGFTAFTSEPTKLIVKLIPKTTSPTAGYPSIKGFYVKAWE